MGPTIMKYRMAQPAIRKIEKNRTRQPGEACLERRFERGWVGMSVGYCTTPPARPLKAP
jgi:hypothetical protein